jgi:hypothetical protein
MVLGQDKKSEQKIKIIVDDGSGKTVLIDTLMKDGMVSDSIRLKDGKIIFIGHPGDKTVLGSHDGSENVSVTVTSDGKDSRKKVKEITVISSGSGVSQDESGSGKIYVYSNSDKGDGSIAGHQKVTVWSGKDGKESETEVEKTKYVINRDGMIITIEGNDYVKVKELVKEIESKLGGK